MRTKSDCVAYHASRKAIGIHAKSTSDPLATDTSLLNYSGQEVVISAELTAVVGYRAFPTPSWATPQVNVIGWAISALRSAILSEYSS